MSYSFSMFDKPWNYGYCSELVFLFSHFLPHHSLSLFVSLLFHSIGLTLSISVFTDRTQFKNNEEKFIVIPTVDILLGMSNIPVQRQIELLDKYQFFYIRSSEYWQVQTHCSYFFSVLFITADLNYSKY